MRPDWPQTWKTLHNKKGLSVWLEKNGKIWEDRKCKWDGSRFQQQSQRSTGWVYTMEERKNKSKLQIRSVGQNKIINSTKRWPLKVNSQITKWEKILHEQYKKLHNQVTNQIRRDTSSWKECQTIYQKRDYKGL